jgi:Cu-processing system ATP-binding protein
MIALHNISKAFKKLKVLKNIELNFNPGECIALVGPNGCGKTTMIKSILSMVLPDSGQILFDGVDIHNQYAYRKHIGYMPQIGRYPENMNIGQVIETVTLLRGSNQDIDEDLYNQFCIKELKTKKMSTLSGGTRQKVSAVLAFMFSPKVLILDEPTAGLDPLAAEVLKDKIIKERNNGKLILVSSHLLAELDDIVSEVVFMQEGTILFHKKTAALKIETGEQTISKSITNILKKSIS